MFMGVLPQRGNKNRARVKCGIEWRTMSVESKIGGAGLKDGEPAKSWNERIHSLSKSKLFH